MAGKHHKRSRIRSSVARVAAPGGLAAAALTATSLSTALMTGTTTAAAPSVELVALITPANSTSQFFAGTTYYGTNWTTVYGTQQVVPFLAGPNGIADAIAQHQDDEEPTGVTASGWGAGQTGTALGILASNADTNDLDNVGLVILDNNTNRAGGGFWTTYNIFAPLLLTSADPTPTELDGVTVLDVGYEYNINGDAPVDPLNPFTLGNSLAAYVYGYGAESTALDITQDEESGDVILHEANGDDTTLYPGTHYIVKDGNIVETHPAGTATSNPSTIYVTVDSGELPLTRPLRLLPGGDILADALDPTMTALVNAGYADGKGTVDNPAIPEDPTVTRPMQPGSSLGALGAVPGSVQDGVKAGIKTAGEDLADPGNLVTKPLAEFGKLPFVSTLPTSLTNSTLAKNNVNTTGAKPLLPGLNKPTGATSSSDHPRPLKKIADSIKSSLNKLAGGAHEQKTDNPENNEG